MDKTKEMEGSVCPKKPSACSSHSCPSHSHQSKQAANWSLLALNWELWIANKLQMFSSVKYFTQFPTDSGSGSVTRQVWGVFRSTGFPRLQLELGASL